MLLRDLRAATEWAAGIFDRVDIEAQGALPTPCTDWDVRVLVVHVVSWNRLVAGGILGITPSDAIANAARATAAGSTDPVPDVIGPSAGHAYRTSAHELLAVLNLDRSLEGTCRLPTGDLPAGTAFTMALADNITHGWDLAVATGQDATMPEAVIGPLERAVANLPIDRGRPTLFADRVPVAGDASRQTRVLAFLGRSG